MTRYDPFSFGQVKLGDQPAKTATPGTPADSADDLLFADAGPKKQAAPADDTSWSLLEENVANLLPGAQTSTAMEFGAEILGEAPPPAAPVAPVARVRPATAPAQPTGRPAPGGANGDQSAGSGQPVRGERAREVRAKAPVAVTVAKPAAAPAPAAVALPTPPRRRGRPLAGVLVPFVICASGGTAASWFAITQQNPVMAGIVGLLTMVSAAFTWLSLRP